MNQPFQPPQTRHPVDQRPHAVIIGAGIGGLSAGIRLGARGYRVTILDRLDQPGGCAAVLKQGGFTFDRGPTIVTAPFLLDELWQLCGKRREDDVPLKAMNPFYRIAFHDGSALDWSGQTVDMRRRIAAFAPNDLAGYDALMAKAGEIYKVGFEKLGFVPFTNLSTMIREVPAMARLRADRSLYTLVSRYVKDERLRIALSFHPLFIGGNPFKVSSIYGLVMHLEKLYGVHYAMGGTGTLVKGLVKLVADQGGTIRTNTDVAEISVERGRATGVVLANGARIAADIVVSNACTAQTYARLLKTTPRKRWHDKKLSRIKQSMGVFVWYFGTNRRYDDVLHHTILMGPRYKGLLDDIFKHKVLAEDFSLYLHRPSASDPTVAPAGHDAFYALVPVPNLQGTTDWATYAETFRQRIEQHLSNTLLPGLKDRVVTSHVMTPLEFQARQGTAHGAAFGMEPLLTQSAYFRPHNLSEEVEGLYLVGANTHPGAGIPGVICSAKILDQLVPDADQIQRSRQGAYHE